MGLGKKTFDAIGGAIASLLTEYKDDLNVAYENAENALAISIGIKIDPTPEGNRSKITLNFVKEKVKDQAIRIVREEQMEMFSGESEI